MAGLQMGLSQVRQPHHDGEQVIEVVHGAAGDLADQFELLGLLQLGLQEALQGHVHDQASAAANLTSCSSGCISEWPTFVAPS